MRINLYDDGSYRVEELSPLVDVCCDVGRGLKDAAREPFIWRTDKGKEMLMEDMATPHLINAVNMIWRNVFGIRKDRPEIMSEWSSEYVDRATKELTAELQQRVEDA